MKTKNNARRATLLILIFTYLVISQNTFGQIALWGTASEGGTSNYGVVYNYQPGTDSYTVKHYFGNTIDGWNPIAGLKRFSNGYLYGMTYAGGQYGTGVIYKLNPLTGAYTVEHNFESFLYGLYGGAHPAGTLILASDGMFYGVTSYGGASYDGTIFKFDPNSGLYTDLYSFVSGTSFRPKSGLMQASNGLFYGTTWYGGTNNQGTIFKFDPSTYVLTTIYNLDETTSGSSPWGKITEASNGMLYGMTQYGGNALNRGTIYKIDPTTDSFTKIHDFDGISGKGPYGSLMEASNGLLYGVTERGGVYDEGILFKLDITSELLTKLNDFNHNETGTYNGYPRCDLMEASDGLLYGFSSGFNSSNGVIFKLNMNTETFTIMHELVSTTGSHPMYTSLLEVNNADIWQGTFDNNWNNASNWLSGEVPVISDDVIIPAISSNPPTLTSAGVCKSISLESNASGTATILDNGYLTVSDIAYAQRYFTGNEIDWHLMSSPMSNAVAGVFNGMYIQSFDNTTYTYSDITDPGTAIIVMAGFAAYSTLSNSNTVTFSGNLNTGSQSASFGLGADSYNWNLMGNPYPSSIDWEMVTIPTGMSSAVYYLEASTGNYLTYVKGIGGTGSQYIMPMQGFFINANASGILSFSDAVRSHLGSGAFYKSKNVDAFILQVDGEAYSDKTFIHFNDDAEVENDGIFDAYKIISTSNPLLPQIFSITPAGKYLSINGLPKTETVKVGFSSLTSGTFCIKAIESIASTGVILEDLITGEMIDLLENKYTFDYSLDDLDNRFVLHFSPLAVSESMAGQININSTGNNVYVSLTENKAGNIFVYNVTGQQVAFSKINRGLNKLTLSKSGIYIVKVVIGRTVATKKVFIK